MVPQRSALQMSGFEMRENGIADRVKNISVSAIKEMVVLAQDYPGAISLAQGTPSFETPAHIRERIKHELDTNPESGKYCVPFTGLKDLRTALSAKLKKNRGITADPARELYVTVGAMEAVSSAMLTVVNPGDEVMLLSPCFPSHIVQVMLAQGTPVYVPLNEKEGWSLDIAACEARITKRTKAIIVTNPANPTGTLFGERDMRALAALAQKHNFWIITDEPYDFLVYDNQPYFSITQIPEIKERLIACLSFSKEYAMSGYRIGHVYAAADVINQMVKLHDALTITAATISQYGALAALQGPQDSVEYFNGEFAKRRDLICSRLDRLPDLFSYQKPQGAYYIFPKIKPSIDDFELAIAILKGAQVVVVPGGAFGPEGAKHVRMHFALSEEKINTAFDRIEKWWKENGQRFF